ATVDGARVRGSDLVALARGMARFVALLLVGEVFENSFHGPRRVTGGGEQFEACLIGLELPVLLLLRGDGDHAVARAAVAANRDAPLLVRLRQEARGVAEEDV